MEIRQINHATSQSLNKLLHLSPELDQELLEECGYVVDIDGDTAGCFALQPLDSSGYWLRQLYLQPESAGNIIVLLEAVLALIKEQSAKTLFVNSHHEKVDTVLQALQFKDADASHEVPPALNQSGKWWIYRVS